MLSDDTDMFVLLVYWVYRADLELLCKLQMERWDRTVNATCMDLGPKCLQLLGMHTLSGCDITSYPYKYPACSRLPMCWVKWTRTTHTDLVEATKFVYCIVL